MNVFTAKGLRIDFKGSKSSLGLPKNFKTFVNALAGRVVEVGSRRRRKNYKTDACRYTQTADGGRCIIGQAIMELYPDLYKELKKFEQTYGFSSPFAELTKALYGNQAQFAPENDQLTFLVTVQGRQDNGDAWGKIIQEEVYGE